MDTGDNNLDNNQNINERDFSQVQVINRAVSILRILRDTGGINLSQLAREVGLARSTVHRIVSTLEAENLVSTSSFDGRIQLGIELISLGSAVNIDLRRELRPYLEGLAADVDETVDLAILDIGRLVFLDQISHPHRLRAVSGIGLTFPLHCTANGKALLAALPKDQMEKLIPEKLESFTPNTILSRKELLEELEKVKTSIIAFDREEHTLGICAIGAVVYGPLGKKAAISIPVPSVRFYGNEDKFVTALRRITEDINRRFSSM